MNILITSAGQRVSLVRSFQNELKKYDKDAKVFTTDMNPDLSPACQVAHEYFKVKRVTDKDYIHELLSICKEQNVRMVIPTIDTELKVLADNKKIFERQGIFLIVSDPPFIEKCRDKRKINKFFLDENIEIPRPIDKNNPTFPLFIKPYDGSLSVDTFLINSKNDLTDYHFQNERLMFMEYMDKAFYDEFTIDMYYGKDSKVKCIVPRKRIHVRAGEINKGVTKKNIIIPFLKERLCFIKGAIGCLTMQVFLHKKNNKIVAIEINPRFGGGFPLSYKAGANYPQWLIREFYFNETISYTEDWEENLLMLRYDDEILVHGYTS